MDLSSKIVLINFIIMVSVAVLDKHILKIELIDIPYLGMVIAIWALITAASVSIWLIYRIAVA